MIVVFDSNVWLESLILQSTPGAAVRFYLKQNNARLALPEVVRLEVEQNLRNNLHHLASSIRQNHRQLLAVFGRLKEVVLPTDEDIEKRVGQVFAEVGIDVIDVPFSLPSARSSFIKTIEKLPPSHGKQQFKDGVLWADCLSLLTDDDVALVTSDKAFFHDGDYRKGLASTLADEAADATNQITIFPDLSDLLAKIRCEVSVDVGAIESEIMDLRREGVAGLLAKAGCSFPGFLGLWRDLYVTENPDHLFIEFEALYDCQYDNPNVPNFAVLVLKGDGIYNLSTDRLEQVRGLGEEIQFQREDGSEHTLKNHVLTVGGAVFGHKEVTHTVRRKIDEPALYDATGRFIGAAGSVD